MSSMICGVHTPDCSVLVRGHRRVGRCRLRRRKDILHEPHILGCHGNRLLTALPMCAVCGGPGVSSTQPSCWSLR